MTYDYHHHKSGKKISIRPLKCDDDIDMLHDWLNQPHTVSNWQLNKNKNELLQHFLQVTQMAHQSCHILAINGRELCYAETYDASQDRLANFYAVRLGDYGFHVLIGPPEEIGQGHSEALFSALTDYLFKCYQAERVLVEPNQNTKQFTILETKLNFSNLGLIRMPEKIASLYAVVPFHFYKIDCDPKDWPVVRMHFPDTPSDNAVDHWLSEVDKLLERASPCVVISTFSPHYQFSTHARRMQALWFKQNKKLLNAYCLGMVRVTTDQNMIDKITSHAMREGMPFFCFPAKDIVEAEQIADGLLKRKVPHGPN